MSSLVGPNGYPLRTVILECPYDTLLIDPATRQIYPKLLALKIRGYQGVYPYGVLPMDTCDYVANHILFCEESPDGLLPHMGFKSVTLSRCKQHYINFPAYDLFRITDRETPRAYTEFLDNVIAGAARDREEVGYNGSWTLSAEFRRMKDKIDFRNITNVLLTRYYQTYNIRHIVAGASAKYKVDHMKIFMGFDYFNVSGEKLPPLNLLPYGGEPFYMMHLKDFAPGMIAMTKEPFYQELWENRITLSAVPETARKAA